ncbi:PREDICTED: protein TASOR isoform X2 [Gekko japonicus]|uniref:Protein TASOR isoform X2 n=1 Tax=Gekko japonicus TaxID=146911 RepID=A0ABM1JVP5_GEKJA|nr:PREDICTED: protein TASOR isoform X2 [Gekko japonicus]
MADAAAASGDEKAQEPTYRAENRSRSFSGSGLSGEESKTAGAEAEVSTQNGGRRERIRSDEEPLLGTAVAVEDRSSPGRGLHKITGSAAHEHLQQQQQQQLNDGLGVSLPKASEDVPPKRNFQIPRKNKERKALFQPIFAESREYDDVVNILHSAYLDPNSKGNFAYKKASLVHSELLEKEFIEKRRELKLDGRSEKELAESYAFLKVDRALVQNICENGLQVGHSKMTVLGSPSMGIYLSRYADLLQANTLDPRATGDVIIFKVIKGRMKSICDTLGVKPMDSTSKSALDPTPKHECHVLKNANKINSVLSYRAYERSQYYFYEYGFDEIRQRPRHVCPYAVVSFSYKDEKVPKYLSLSRSKISSMDKADKAVYTLWNGQLLNRGTLVCHVALKSETCPLLPCKLPEKLDVDMVMSIEDLTRKISPKVFYKESYSGEKEEFRSGLYCSLYEVVEKTRSGSNLEGLLQKLEKEKLVIVKPLVDGGYLLLLSPCQMASPYDNQAGRPRSLQALFLFRNHRGVGTSKQKHDQKSTSTSTSVCQDMVKPDFTRFIQSLHYGLLNSRKDPKSDLNIAMERYIRDYLKRYSKFKPFVLYEYKPILDEKRFLHAGPKNKSNLDSALRTYIFGSEAYQIPISKIEKMDGNRKPQQFSPVSDYEAPEEESDCSKRTTGKRNSSKGEMIAAQKKRCQPKDYDDESLRELINLIQCKKNNVDREFDAEGNRNKSRSKRKLESSMESPQKRLKNSTSSEKDCHYDGERASESLSSIIADLGGRDTDLRQQNVPDSSVTESVISKKVLDALADPDFLARFLNHALAENNTRQLPEYESIPAQVKEEPELPNAAHIENVQFKDSQSSVMLETTAPCLLQSVDVSANEAGMDHMLHLKETSTGSVSSFDGCSSPCPSTPLEQKYHRQHSNSNNTGETAMNWKLIPITGLKSPEELLAYSPPKDASQDDPRVLNRQKMSHLFTESSAYDIQKGIEDAVYTGQEEKLEDQHEFATNHCLASKHCMSGIIEKAILDEYKLFTSKIQETLQQKNIMYVSGISKPVFSAKERVMRLSQYICLQASDIAVQEYIEGLSEKLNKVALSSYGILRTPNTCNSRPENDLIMNTALNLSSEEPLVPAPAADDFDMSLLPEQLDNNTEEDFSINEQKPLETLDTGKEQSPVRTTIETNLTADGNLSSADPLQQTDKPQKPADNVNVTTQPGLADLIISIKPEVFDSIVKIIKDVQKNTVKFYIHEEQENTLCKEIKEYLIKLGNTECHPEQFIRRRADMDKLLIIIQNEDIASQIHKIPCLVTLKRLSCVNFAGVDSLDDVKNHTYNDLFVSGGFIVSDETVLNPEFITVDQLDRFLKFLEEMSTPDGKWQWKVHCKIQKKLKEMGRINANANANALLTLLNAYQKKHMVEILSYHNCDSQTRNTPELECLINLQAQNLQQRHIVFLTEKNVQAFGNYAENGIVVTTVDNFMHNFKSLVGYHNSVTEENSLPPSVDHDKQSVLVENDEKDEEDMSLDSGDEASQIEVCNDVSKHDSHLEALRTETKGSHGADCQQTSQLDTQLSAEGHILVTEKTSKMDVQDIQPVTPVSTACSTEGEKNNAQVPFNNFQIYNRQLSVPHQFSHFNVLTHQTFLGAAYPVPTSRNQESGNYFLTAYSQNMNMDQSSSPSNWDVSCDSSRPYSKQN